MVDEESGLRCSISEKKRANGTTNQKKAYEFRVGAKSGSSGPSYLPWRMVETQIGV